MPEGPGLQRTVEGPGGGPEAQDRLVDIAGVRIVVPAWRRGHEGLRAAVSTRVGGVSRDPLGMNTSFKVGDDDRSVRMNRDRFFEAAGIPPGSLATAGQVHGSTIVVVDRPGHYPESDGLVTERSGLYLGVSVADCVPILLFDRNRRVAAAVHSGWKGSREKIAERCVRLMGERFSSDPGDIEAYIGPSAGGCCYEVGAEVAGHFPQDALEALENGKYRLDLRAFNRSLLAGCGIPGSQILVSDRCTIHQEGTFHSHRRDRERSGRMLAVIGFV
jgi:YfiH family protein